MEGIALLSLFLLVVILDRFSGVQTSAMHPGIHCIESEKYALIKFSQGFKNPSQSMLSWKLEQNCCSWKGVECDNTTGHVITLDLHKQFLQGDLGIALLGLPHLRHLDLSQNVFLGPQIPKFIYGLKNLEYLNLSRNSLMGNVPPTLPSKLKYLDISRNQMEGPLARSITQLNQLVVLDVAWNSFSDLITEHFLNFSDLKMLDLSSNSFIVNISATWMPRFQLDSLRLQSCQLGAQFPQWIRSQKELSFIDISGANISGEVPDWFWNLSAKAYHIDLSRNNFTGELPEFTERVSLINLDLSWNNFHGPLPRFSPKMMTLILAGNSFNGTIAPVCESLVMNNSLSLLDLSSNSLSGKLSDCWRYGKNLELLKLADNRLSGEIPPSIGHLTNLFYLQLQGNNFSKNLPSSLKNIAGLKILDVSNNSLSGNIPFWLGENLNSLEILKLRRNKFHGNIPRQICQLRYLYLLDLSSNALSGIIPRCLENLHTMSGMEEAHSFTYGPYADYINHDHGVPLEPAIVIDLSENHLSGEIPQEITGLTALWGLNLSTNNFAGAIPRDIGNFHNLKFLDLSRNKLSCTIPPSITELQFLSFVNFSFNDLTGKIPSIFHYTTFDNSSYFGNPNLCGFPVLRGCSDHLHEDMTHCNNNIKQEAQAIRHEENNWLEEYSFYISMGIGFNTAFFIFWATLTCKESWRYAYMSFLDNMGNKIYVFVAIRLKKIKQQRQRG